MTRTTESSAALHRINKTLIWAGFKQLLPISLFVTAFGAAFGLAAAQQGLDHLIILLMSALVSRHQHIALRTHRLNNLVITKHSSKSLLHFSKPQN